MSQPDISVLMPFYNPLNNYDWDALGKAYLSTLAENKTGIEVELCMVDDGSTDGYLDLYPSLKDRTRVHSNNQGVAAALNTAAKMATGRYIIVQSVRSWYEPGAFKAMVEALDANPEIGFVYGKTQYHGAQEHIYTPPPFIRERFWVHFDSLFGYMYRREALDAGCRYAEYIEREGRHIDVSDYDFVMQLIVKMGYRGLALRDVLALHYLYSGTGQMTNLVHKYQGEIDAIFRQRWGEAA